MYCHDRNQSSDLWSAFIPDIEYSDTLEGEGIQQKHWFRLGFFMIKVGYVINSIKLAIIWISLFVKRVLFWVFRSISKRYHCFAINHNNHTYYGGLLYQYAVPCGYGFSDEHSYVRVNPV